MKNKKRLVKLYGYIGVWKNKVREEFNIDNKPFNIICVAQSNDNEKIGYITIDCPVFRYKGDAKKFYNSKDWEIRKAIITFAD